MVPSLPWCLWNNSMSLNGKSQITSLFKTKKGVSSSSRISLAKASGPAAMNTKMIKNQKTIGLKFPEEIS